MVNATAAERASVGRIEQFKPKWDKQADAARRREALVSQQSDARALRLADVRRITMESLLGSHENDLEAEVEVESDVDEADAVDDLSKGATASSEAGMDVDDTGKKSRGQAMRRLRMLHRTIYFARQFQIPEWMLDVPDDLASNWLVQVRPEGDRVLILSDGGKVEVRRKNGYVLERYTDTRLPRGLTILDAVLLESASTTSKCSATAPTDGGADDVVLDANDEDCESAAVDETCDMDETGAVDDCEMEGYSNKGRGRGGRGTGGRGRASSRPGRLLGSRTYAVCDVLVWGDQDMGSAEAECRMYWLESRFAELSGRHARRARPLRLISAEPANVDALRRAYSTDVGYMKDSFTFLHREGHYSIGQGVTPLSLQWRDKHISRFVIDTPDEQGANLPERQSVVLELRGNGYLRTADRAIVAKVTEQDAKTLQGLSQNKSGKMLLRCEVDGVDIVSRKVSGVRILGHVAPRSRVWPDSWSRIAFQHMNRKDMGALSFTTLEQAAAGVPTA